MSFISRLSARMSICNVYSRKSSERMNTRVLPELKDCQRCHILLTGGDLHRQCPFLQRLAVFFTLNIEHRGGSLIVDVAKKNVELV